MTTIKVHAVLQPPSALLHRYLLCYPPGSSHPPPLLFSASSQAVAVHGLPCSQVGIHSLYKGKISSLPLLFLLFSPLLVSLFLQTELAMFSLFIFLSVLTLFCLLSTIALAPSKEQPFWWFLYYVLSNTLRAQL